MKKYYKVNLYKVDKIIGPIHSIFKPKLIDEIIVDYSSFLGTSYEIMTKLSIDVFPSSSVEKGKLTEKYCSFNDLNNYGFQLFTLKDDYIEKNRINEKELDSYIESFENSKYREVYEQMKILTKNEKKNIMKKIKSINGKYK